MHVKVNMNALMYWIMLRILQIWQILPRVRSIHPPLPQILTPGCCLAVIISNDERGDFPALMLPTMRIMPVFSTSLSCKKYLFDCV